MPSSFAAASVKAKLPYTACSSCSWLCRNKKRASARLGLQIKMRTSDHHLAHLKICRPSLLSRVPVAKTLFHNTQSYRNCGYVWTLGFQLSPNQ